VTAEQDRHRIMRTPTRHRRLTQLGDTDREQVHKPAPGRVPMIAPPAQPGPTAGIPRNAIASVGSTRHVTLPAPVCSPLDLERASHSVRSPDGSNSQV